MTAVVQSGSIYLIYGKRWGEGQLAKKEGPSISGGEWRIMEFLWQESPQTLMQMVNAMEAEMGWAKSTVVTMVTRLEAKGFIYYKAGERARRYYPSISREEAAEKETSTLFDRIFGGSIGLLVSTFAKQKGLDEKEIEELYGILQQAEKKND